jgi:hypothetical protein
LRLFYKISFKHVQKTLLLSLFITCSVHTVKWESIPISFKFSDFPRQAALGGKVITIYDDVNQVNFNPATINAEMDNHLALIMELLC